MNISQVTLVVAGLSGPSYPLTSYVPGPNLPKHMRKNPKFIIKFILSLS